MSISFRTKRGRRSIRNPSDNSGVNLATALKVRCKARDRDFSKDELIINWGCSNTLKASGIVLNYPIAVSRAVNKLECFRHLETVWNESPQDYIKLLPYSTSPEGITWNGRSIARTTLTGNSGQGIVPFTKGEEPTPQARLYTQYIKYRTEFRVHVFRGEVIYSQIKRRRTTENLEQLNLLERSKIIRNLDNGWVYCELPALEDVSFAAGGELVTIPYESLAYAAVEAVEALGLDFGAVDLIYSWKRKCFYLLEVNTAPGLKDNAFRAYESVLRNIISTI